MNLNLPNTSKLTDDTTTSTPTGNLKHEAQIIITRYEIVQLILKFLLLQIQIGKQNKVIPKS